MTSDKGEIEQHESSLAPELNHTGGKSYAEDPVNGQTTVLGTMGQDPDHKAPIPWSAWAILFLCALAQFQNTFIGIAPAASAYAIAGPLNGMDRRIWIVQAQGIPSIATGPIFGIIADLYGRKWVVVGCFLLFCISNIINMTTSSMNILILGQTLAGCACGISGLMYALASEVMPSKYRSHAQTAVNVFAGLATLPAFLGMGAATTADPVDGWRWIFRTLLIIDGILVVGFGFLYNPPPRTAKISTFWEKMKSMDWIGYTLLIGGLVPLLMGFAWAGDATKGWTDPHAYGCVAGGCIGFILCLLYEWKGTSTGFLHHALFKEGRNFPIAIFVIAVEGALFYLVNNIYPNQVFGLWVPTGGMKASAYLLPFFMVIVVLAPFMSLYVTRFSDLRWPTVAGFVFFSVAIIGFAMAGTRAELGLVFNALAGVGFVAPLILVMAMVQLSTPPLFIGVASALTISARTLGGTVGYGIAAVIFDSISNTGVPAAIAEAAIGAGLSPANVGSLIIAILSHGPTAAIPGITPAILAAAGAAAGEATAHAYKITWLAFLPGTVIAAIASAFFKNPKSRMNWVVDAPLNATVPIQDRESALESYGAGNEKL